MDINFKEIWDFLGGWRKYLQIKIGHFDNIQQIPFLF
jgi:hypothetical protein